MSAATIMKSAVAPLGNLGGILFPMGALCLLTAPGILFYQARQWFITGHWPPISVADGLAWAHVTLPAAVAGLPLVDKQFLHFPLSLTLLAAIGLPLFAYARFSKWLESVCEPDITPLN